MTGDGPVPAVAMAVGEAPGYREDEESKPFVGRSGQYLDAVLEASGLPRSTVFISNVVKCRPPDNETPTKSQIAACKPYLVTEIKAVNPTYLMALGGPALTALTGKSGVMKLAGTWLKSKPEFGSRRVFVCMHPAAVLRREFLKPKFEFYIRQFANIVNNVSSDQVTDYRLVTNTKIFKEAKADIETAKVISWDIENSKGFNPHNGGKILTISVATRPGKAWVFPFHHPQMHVRNIQVFYRFFKRLLEAPLPRKVAHNGQYERKWMLHLGIDTRCDFDTKIAAYLLDENGPTGLKPLAKALCQAPNWDENIDFKAGIPRLKDLWPYNAADADYTLQLYFIYRERLLAIPELARFFKFLMMPAMHLLADIEYRGIAIDRERLNARTIEAEEHREQIKQELRALLPSSQIIRDRKGRECIDDVDYDEYGNAIKLHLVVNWNSTAFLGWFLYKYLGLPIVELTATGRPGTREAVLQSLTRKHYVVARLMEFREWTGRITKFLQPWVGYAIEHDDGGGLRLHPEYNLTKTDAGKGTETGRLSATDPNIQQVPRESFIRSIITARKGWGFGTVDLSQIELRLAAWLANERNMLRMFRDGCDIHREMAVEITGKSAGEITKEERKKAKASNFGYLYGMYPKKFQIYAREKYSIEVTIEEAQASRNTYFNKFPELLAWHESVRRFVTSAGYVKSPFGRRRRLPHIHSHDRELRNQAERQAINSPVQATASDLNLLGSCILSQVLSQDIFLVVGLVHDEILFEYDLAYEDSIRQTVRETMENLPTKEYFGVEIGVPIIAEVTMGTHWQGT